MTTYGEEVYAEEAEGMEEAVSLRKDNRDVLNNTLLRFLTDNIKEESLPVGSSIREAITFRNQQRAEDVSSVLGVMTLGGVLSKEIETHETEVGAELDLHIELIKEAYPLIEALSDNYSFNALEKSVDMLTDYVVMCDTAEKPNQAALAA